VLPRSSNPKQPAAIAAEDRYSLLSIGISTPRFSDTLLAVLTIFLMRGLRHLRDRLQQSPSNILHGAQSPHGIPAFRSFREAREPADSSQIHFDRRSRSQ